MFSAITIRGSGCSCRSIRSRRNSNPVGQFHRYRYANNNPYKFADPDGRIANFALKAAADFALEAGIQYATTGTVDLGAAAIETGKGLLNPLKTVERARDLKRIVEKGKRGAEPPQLARGKRAHREEPVRPGERAEVPTPSGKRMDRYNEEAAHIREIKPNNPRALREGERQVQGYKKEKDQETGRAHTTEVTPYDPKKYE